MAKSSGYHFKFKKVLEKLKQSKLKNTQARRALLKILIEEHGPFTMEELFQRLGKKICDLVTVYRCISEFEKIGLVQRCDFGDGSYRYEMVFENHHHHHIICRICRKVESLHGCWVEKLEQLVRKKGYAQVSHALEFFGVCLKCQKLK